MHKGNFVNAAAFAASVCLAAPSYAANDAWQFTVTRDQNGPNVNCSELSSLPCTITGSQSPYVLGTLTIDAPLAGYRSDIDANGNVVVDFDDNHIISFKPAISDLVTINFPNPNPNYPLVADIAVNEVNGNSLSGVISLRYAFHAPGVLVMTGTDNLWTGYWSEWGENVHQFWVQAKKL